MTVLCPVVSLALMYARSLNDALAEFSPAKMPAARRGEKTRLSGSGLKDLKHWMRVGEEGWDGGDDGAGKMPGRGRRQGG